MNKLFMVKENRDKEAKRLKEKGYQVKRSSIHNQLLHPMYVEDYPREITLEEKGFGNTIYQTHFSVLYSIDTK